MRSAPPDWAPVPARGAVTAPDNSPPVVGGLSPTRASSERSGTLTGHGVRATGGRDAPSGATVAGVRSGRDGARGRVARARAGGPCGVPGAGRRQRDRRRELPARQPAQRVGHQRAPATRRIQGFATDISVNTRRRRSASRSTRRATSYRIDIYRLGYYGGDGRAQGRDASARRQRCRRTSRRACTDAATRPGRLRQLGASPRRGRCRPTAVSGIYFAKLVRDRRPAGAQPHRLRRARRRAQLGPAASRRRTRPGRPTTTTAATACTRAARCGRQHRPRLQGQLQPAVRHARRPSGRGLRLQRRVPDGPLARSQRLRRQLHDRRRHRSLRRR